MSKKFLTEKEVVDKLGIKAWEGSTKFCTKYGVVTGGVSDGSPKFEAAPLEKYSAYEYVVDDDVIQKELRVIYEISDLQLDTYTEFVIPDFRYDLKWKIEFNFRYTKLNQGKANYDIILINSDGTGSSPFIVSPVSGYNMVALQNLGAKEYGEAQTNVWWHLTMNFGGNENPVLTSSSSFPETGSDMNIQPIPVTNVRKIGFLKTFNTGYTNAIDLDFLKIWQ